MVSGRDIVVEGCSEVGLGVCSQLAPSMLASLHPPSSRGCCFLVLPPKTERAGEQLLGWCSPGVFPALLQADRVISGEPGGIYHLPWEPAGL